MVFTHITRRSRVFFLNTPRSYTCWTRRNLRHIIRKQATSRGHCGCRSFSSESLDHVRTDRYAEKKEETAMLEAAALRTEIDRFASMCPTPVSLRCVLERHRPWLAARFLHAEFPVRCAERISMIEENVPWWNTVPELREVHSRHIKAFSAMRSVHMDDCLDDFTAVVRKILTRNTDVVHLMARGMHRLSRDRGKEFDAASADKFLDEFLLNRIGTNILMKQYVACAASSWSHKTNGIVDLNCNPTDLCRAAVLDVQNVCKKETGICPVINVESHSAAGDNDGASIKFPYIPEAMSYIVQELLKNSCRATVDATFSLSATNAISDRPISVVVSADARRVLIHISDRAGGIPFDVGRKIWSYLYTTAKRNLEKECRGQEGPTELAGYGVGLPLSRLYSRYLGGSLQLVSLPGYGTHAYVFLPRLSSEQVEVVPDKDYKWSLRESVGEFVL